jgi:hypothetical protein
VISKHNKVVNGIVHSTHSYGASLIQHAFIDTVVDIGGENGNKAPSPLSRIGSSDGQDRPMYS